MTLMDGHKRIQDAPEPIAIVSAACRLPGHVNSPHKLWELVQSGGTAVSNEVPKSRFNSEGHFDSSGRPGTMKALSGMFIEDIDPAAFDASFFNLNWADATAMDPQQRQLLEVVYECFENGGVPLEAVSGKHIGCYVGSFTGDYHDMQNRDPEQRMLGMVVGTGRAILSVNLWLSPEHTQELGTMRTAYSFSGKCHTFDAKADGYCRAEAVNAVYLKRLSDAVRDGDPIRALIRGTASNSDGWTPGINSPSAEAQAAMIREAYNDAGIDSSQYTETGYLECHGTGTPAGDPLEVKGAASVLAHMRPQSNPLIIGSVKSNIGHSGPGAGLSGLIKAMLAVEEGKIPGNPTFLNPNPGIDFDGLRSGHASKISVDGAQFAKTPQEAARIGFVFTGQGAQWSQMGAELVRMFPETARPVIEKLDRVLQELPVGIKPEWSLLEELTEARSPEHLSKPEFSQPLVTALQLAQLAVLEPWNVRAEAVVGHSSGEIAAACSAGLMTPRQAILTAYFRGLACKNALAITPKGMLAVGLGAKDVQSYIDGANNIDKGDVLIACYNSPANVTLSGPTSKLAELEGIIKADGHFARILRVEVAYHSHHMNKIANYYEELLEDYAGLEDGRRGNNSSKHMISTVTEDVVTGDAVCNAAYWKANMMSPVRFEGPCNEMITNKKLAANFIIELGPSNTLSGPVTQIAKAAKVDHLTYTAANKRGQAESSHAIFDVAGHLFLQNADFSLSRVNIHETTQGEVGPKVIVDLPNYQWNHSTQYWHESLASKDWRFKKFPAHDLLGSKVLGTLWQSPSWHRMIRLSHLPWLRDHQIGSEILFPAAGYIAMAMEAVRQTAVSTATSQERDLLKARDYQYCLRDVRFPRGLVLEDDVDVHIMLLLVPMANLGQGWWEYKITSLAESGPIASSSSPAPSPEKWNVNSTRLVRLEMNPDASLSRVPEDIFSLPLDNPTPGQMWYKSLRDAGYSYGPDFQKLVAVESTEGKSSSRSLISLEPPRSRWEPQSEYPLHPAPLDGCLQSMFTSLHRGNRSNLDKVLVPRGINEMTISGHTWKSGEALSVTTSNNALGDASLYSPATGSLIMQINGLSFSPMLDGRESFYMSHMYTQLTWEPDLQHLDTDEKLQQALSSVDDDTELHVQKILDLAAHKAPNLRVLEFNLLPGSAKSLWLARDPTPRPVRAACSEFHFATNNADTVLSAQEQYAEWPAAQDARFSVLDPFRKTFTVPAGSSNFDLVVIRWSQHEHLHEFETLAGNLRRLTSGDGSVVLYDPEKSILSEGKRLVNENSPVQVLQRFDLTKVRQTMSGSCIVAEVSPERTPPPSNNDSVVIVRFSPERSTLIDQTISQLRTGGWDFTEFCINDESGPELSELSPKSTVLVLDEMARPLLATATEDEWASLQTIIQKECNLVWVTQGSQIRPTEPLKAVAHGIFRTVRVEVSMIRIMTVDVESATIESLATNLNAINMALREVNSAKKRSLPIECEIAERGGLLHVGRIWPDEGVNKRKVEDNAGGPPPVMTNFHDSKSTIRLVTSRPGSLEALHFAEKSLGGSEAQAMGPDEIEVEMVASGCSSKDVDAALGNISENSEGLGFEGAGVVVRVGGSVTTRRIGQRVAVFGRGCFANRVTVSSKATLILPNGMPFKEAATLPVAFLTSLYALGRIAHGQVRDRVLIHSAFTDIGIACVRLCQRLGCDAFTTAGNLEQRQFLAQDLGLSEDHIFTSEPTVFPRALHEATKGHGLDVIISQSANVNLDYENLRLLAPGGRLIRISNGGADAGNLLFTGSLAANCSFQSLDITALPLDTIESVFSELSQLIADGSVRPLSPCRRLGYEEIPEALRLLRGGNQVGKVIISNGYGTKLAVPTRPAASSVKSIFNPGHSYLFVGGLRGISGSLAIHLASHGAKHIAVMSRSGHEDKISQSIAHNIKALGCSLDLLQGDVNSISDVRRVFSEVSAPVGGIIQGAAVFRDRTFESMSHADYHAALSCKVTGTSNLHFVSLETKQPISFFTMLSSISGVIGQPGQANYAGGNAFEDAFAEYRRASGLPAISINFGPIEDVGVIHGNENLQSRFDGSTLIGINEGLLRRIFDYSILQQHPDPQHRLNPTSQGQMITSLLVPQPEDSDLLRDVRFRGLRIFAAGGPRSPAGADKDKGIQVLLLLTQSQDPDRAAVRAAAITVVGARLAKQLRLTDALDPTRPLSYFGLDSLAAVELRNWSRLTLGVELTTLDVLNAASLVELCDKVVGKMGVAV
ncbi:hypothetical protein DL763_009737 [Monosporascus cannonballus]|nr:hypothetical protein DL763_009737 [Monosporascus cannonballus]